MLINVVRVLFIAILGFPLFGLADARLQNLATRGFVGTGDNVLIGGLVITGTQSKFVIIRARGPALTTAGVPDALSNPNLTLFSGAIVIDSNDDWQDHENSDDIPDNLKPVDPTEAVIATTLAPGAYTAIVTGFNGEEGIGLIEIFEASDTGETRLLSIATRGFVGTGDNVLIGSLVISGTENETVVIRAKGPSLADAGVPGVLADPVMTLFSGANVIDSNDNWRDHANADSIPVELRPNNDLEATIYTQLAPGAYTAIVAGVGNTTGVGIVEVFEITTVSPNADSDGDGIPDTEDAFPQDAGETLDTDGDGIGNNADTDDDGDGVADTNDISPLDSNIHTLPLASSTTFSVNLLPGIQTQFTGTLTGSAQDKRSLTYSLESTASTGVVTLNDASQGTFSYETLTGTVDAGSDSFSYKVNDGFIDSSTVTVTLNLNTDPLYKHQWHLDNTGQLNFASTPGTFGADMNIDNVIAEGITGAGIKVAVLDSGMEIAHEDLADNVIADGSHNFINDSSDPTSTDTTGDHGTSVAGLIAARGWNNLGGRGVAPLSGLKGFNVLARSEEADFIAALGGASYSSDVDIFNQSYGSDLTDDSFISEIIEDQYKSGVTTLRNGKGALYVRSSGNAFNEVEEADCSAANAIGISCQNAAMDPEIVLPFNITVGALAATGKKASYSTAGASIWISAAGGESGLDSNFVEFLEEDVEGPAMLTTDQSGCTQGYVTNMVEVPVNAFEDNGNSPDNPNCNYTSTFNGTSSAAPVASGAMALILESNPNLSWRDMKQILASTAVLVDEGIAPLTVLLGDGDYIAEPAWTTNSAGFKFHNWYGFGRIDVAAATTAAKTYVAGSLGTFVENEYIGGDELTIEIPDNSVVGAVNTLSDESNLTIEAIRIFITVTHPATGELGIELTSPSGTRSVLFTIKNAFGTTADLGFELLSNAFYGENSNGTWTIKVVDSSAGSTGTLTGWQLKVYGH